MEWVETTGKTVDEAKDHALDQLGVAADEAEFEVLESPRPGLFGRLRGEARVRSRVRPNELRPKVDRRRRGSDRSKSKQEGESAKGTSASTTTASTETADAVTASGPAAETKPESTTKSSNRGGGRSRGGSKPGDGKPKQNASKPKEADNDHEQAESVEATVEPSPDEVGAAAVRFMDDLVRSFGLDGSTSLQSDGAELDVVVDGNDLGLLIGPGGRTLMAVQNLARVAAQRRLGDHDTRLRVDVAGYREKRRVALEAFAQRIADEVRDSGTPRALEPMSSADRKVVHDALNTADGVVSRSEGDDPRRHIVVAPAS